MSPDIPVLFRDGGLIVVHKPVGLATTAPDGGPCLVAEVQKIDPDAPQLHALSRLDTQVSGIVCFARTAAANLAALEARQAGTFRRRYIGLTLGHPRTQEGTWEFAIGFDPQDPRRRRALPPGSARRGGAKDAKTSFHVRAQAGDVCALDLFPHTGRTHQLRVHASAAGLPLFGDVAYGGPRRHVLQNGRVLTAPRVMLHCAHVSLPRGGTLPPLTLELHPPADFCRVFASAGGDPRVLSEAAPQT
jgi:23S rRNA pseudouridine1911/1915/1917 synthase